ncbi:MAG: winged helix-turn-helix transcriptional regulator [Spirochaetales bacterium]|nr:winged helix-turn-helix transcriptional regulator [Spirochaetales bacterium]
MEAKADKLINLFTQLIETHYNDEKSACADTPLFSLNGNDLKVLCALCKKNSPNIKEISAELSLPMSTLTGIFNKLVSRGLVSRDRCKHDRRVVRVDLTEKGQEAAKIKNRTSQKFAVEILNSLSDSEQTELLRLLNKIVVNVTP